MEARARKFATKVFEITTFLHDVIGVKKLSAKIDATITYHDACAGLRELGISKQPRNLLAKVKGVELKELEDSETCCGFGGTFSVKYSEISNAIVSAKTEKVNESKADYLLAGDMGCLMNMAGKLKREGSNIQVRHVCEVLAGMTDAPAIGESKKS